MAKNFYHEVQNQNTRILFRSERISAKLLPIRFSPHINHLIKHARTKKQKDDNPSFLTLKRGCIHSSNK